MIERRDQLFPRPADETDKPAMKKWATDLTEAFFSFASNRPTKFGVYRVKARSEIDELFSHYEYDLTDAAAHLDGEGVTRLAQAIYLLKTGAYENIWWRVENRIHELAEQEGALDMYNVVNIIRAFTRSQDNRSSASDKLYIHLEATILKDIDTVSARDLGHLMYGYSIRDVGNPEIYKAFEQRFTQLVDEEAPFDHAFLSNAIYYMLFRENDDEKLWKAIIEATIIQKDILPLMHYKPFKISRYYLTKRFPEWDLHEYTESFYYADRYWNAAALDEYYRADFKYLEFKSFLNRKCLVYPICFMTLWNTFNLHYVFYE